MDLIIKPTGLCNFKCTFCSASEIPITNGKIEKVPKKLIEIIKTIKPDNLIITGGDPLMVEPQYYYELYDASQCNISLTTNLKNFYLNPNKWVDLFKEDWLGICTSFQYGDKRKWDINTIYTEEMFIKVYNKFKKLIGKDLPFIAVIDYDNEETVIDLCKLAKRLKTIVRINGAIGQGLQEYTYPRYKMFQHYINIIEQGYGEYESYCNKFDTSMCPINDEFRCENCIRSCYIDENDEIVYHHCEHQERIIPLDYKNDILNYESNYPHQKYHINENCWQCELFSLCHGCVIQRNRTDVNHCEEMLKMKNKLIKYGWVRKGLI